MTDNNDRYDVTVYYSETDWDQYDNVELLDSGNPHAVGLIDTNGMTTTIPTYSVRKFETVAAGTDAAADDLDDEDDTERTCDRCGRTGIRGFQRVKNATICTTKGCEARYRANLKRAREGK